MPNCIGETMRDTIFNFHMIIMIALPCKILPGAREDPVPMIGGSALEDQAHLDIWIIWIIWIMAA